MSDKIMLVVNFIGTVQGVFFRQHVKDFADHYNIKGYVKNLPNGSVEVVAVAEKSKLEKFLDEIEKKPGHGSIDKIEKKYLETTQEFNNFEILY